MVGRQGNRGGAREWPQHLKWASEIVPPRSSEIQSPRVRVGYVVGRSWHLERKQQGVYIRATYTRAIDLGRDQKGPFTRAGPSTQFPLSVRGGKESCAVFGEQQFGALCLAANPGL